MTGSRKLRYPYCIDLTSIFIDVRRSADSRIALDVGCFRSKCIRNELAILLLHVTHLSLIHYAIKIIVCLLFACPPVPSLPCEPSPCRNDMDCFPRPFDPFFICECDPGVFAGIRCEIGKLLRCVCVVLCTSCFPRAQIMCICPIQINFCIFL